MGRSGAERTEQGRRPVDSDVRAYYARRLGCDPRQPDTEIKRRIRTTLRTLNDRVNTTNPDPEAVAEFQLINRWFGLFTGKEAETKEEQRQRIDTTRLEDGIPHPRDARHDRFPTNGTESSASPEESFDDMLARQRKTRRVRRRNTRIGFVAAGAAGLAAAVVGIAGVTPATNSSPSVDSNHPAAASSTIVSPRPSPSPIILRPVDDCGPEPISVFRGGNVREFACRYPGENGRILHVAIYAEAGKTKMVVDGKVVEFPADQNGTERIVPVANGCVVVVGPGNQTAVLKCP